MTRGARRGKLILLLTSLPLLSGCVSALVGGLGNPDVAIPNDPCPDPTPKAVERLLNRSPLLSAAQLPLAGISLAGTDLDVGKALLGTSSGSSPLAANAVSLRAGIGQILGLDLSAFATDTTDLSPESANQAEKAFSAPSLVSNGRRSSPPNAALFSQSPQIAVGKAPSTLSIHAIARATAENGWDSAFVASLGRFYKAGGLAPLRAGTMSVETTQLYAELVKRFMVAQYFKAYFRNGKIVSIKLSTEKLKAALKAKLENTISDPTLRDKVKDDIDSLSDDIVKELCGDNPNCLALGTIGETTFTTRAGKSYGFSGINVDLDPAGEKKISIKGLELSPEIVSDLVRVFVEALGDYQFAVPGVAKSTACDTSSYLCGAPDEADVIKDVNEFADKVEAGTSSITGIAIRGGWLISLNNEALASGIQTAISVYSRKVAERVAWAHKSHQCPGVVDMPITFNDVPLAVN